MTFNEYQSIVYCTVPMECVFAMATLSVLPPPFLVQCSGEPLLQPLQGDADW